MKKILNFTEFVNEGLKQDTIISINESDSKIEKADVLQNTNKRLYNFVMKLLYGPNLENINKPLKGFESLIWGKNLSQIVSNDPTKNTAGILWNTETIIDKLVEVIRNIDMLKSPVLISLLVKYNDLKDINIFKNDPDWNTLLQNEKDYITNLLDNFNFENYSKLLKEYIYSNSKVNYKSDLGILVENPILQKDIVNLPGYSFSKITDVSKIGDFLLNKLCNYTFYYLLNKFKEKVSELSKIPQMDSSTKTPVSTKPKASKSKRKLSSPQVSTETKLTTADLSKWGY